MVYEVTGVDYYGKRFKIVTTSLPHAMGINLWRGSVWMRYRPARRTLIKRVWN